MLPTRCHGWPFRRSTGPEVRGAGTKMVPAGLQEPEHLTSLAPPLPQILLSAEQRCGRHKEFSHHTAGVSHTFDCVPNIYVGLAIFKNYLFKHKASSTVYIF